MSHPKKRKYSFHTRFIAIISIAIPLFILGWVGVLESIQKGMEREMREGLTFTINLDKEMEGEKAEALSQELAQHRYIKEVRYISPAEAAKELEEELGENPELVLGHNPLLPSIELHLKAEYTDPDSLHSINKWSGSALLSPRHVLYGRQEDDQSILPPFTFDRAFTPDGYCTGKQYYPPHDLYQTFFDSFYDVGRSKIWFYMPSLFAL